MAPFVSKGGVTPKTRVYDRDGIAHVRSMGTSDPEVIPQVSAFILRMRKQKRWAVLDAIIARSLSAADAYTADCDGTLTQVVEAIVAVRARAKALAAQVDLSPLVDQYLTDATYIRQVRRLIPAGVRFPISDFTRGRIATFLRTLTQVRRTTDNQAPEKPASVATKQRYRAALSAFAKALVEHEHLDANPVREVSSARQSKSAKPIVYLEPEDVKRLVLSLSGVSRALEACMAGSGMEMGACQALRARDIDLETRIILARGTKNQYRSRYIEVTEDWAWEILREHVRGMTPNTPVFPIDEYKALRLHKTAAKLLGLPKTTLHNHRNSYTVMQLKRGADHQWLKNQLGHAPHSTLLYTVYGVHINAARLTAAQAARMGAATNPATTPHKLLEVPNVRRA